jgi:hypothetical protein
VNHDHFDKLNRSLGATMSRRDFGRTAAGAGLGSLFGSAFGALDAEAKQKRDRTKGEKRKSRTVTRTLRGSITQTFTSTESITVPNGAPVTLKGPAGPYPSTIEVSGLLNGIITDVDLLLLDFTHRIPEDVDILVSAPDGRQAFVMSDVGSTTQVTNINLTLDDEADSSLPGNSLDSGDFRPTDLNLAGADLDTFDVPAPVPDGTVALSTFDGANPNGTWRLFVMDDVSGDAGAIGSWALRITADVDTDTVDEQVPAARDKQKGKRGRRR